MKLPPAEEAFGDLTPARVAFTPKGGCPLKREVVVDFHRGCGLRVAFTPKGGCPLKLVVDGTLQFQARIPVAFTPKGGCPLKRSTRGR